MWSIVVWFVVPGIVMGLGLFMAWRANKMPIKCTGLVMLVLIGMALGTCLAILPLFRIEIHAQIARFHSVRQSVEAARNGNTAEDIERAAMLDKIVERAALSHKTVEANEWLARSRYYASRWYLDVFWPDEVLMLEPIR